MKNGSEETPLTKHASGVAEVSSPSLAVVRVQRERKRGWRKPDNTVCVTRGTIWGNPFIVRPDLAVSEKVGPYFAVPTVEDAVMIYREFLCESPDLVDKAKFNLRGKNLACWCALDQPCHADVLLELANAEQQP